MQNEFEGVTLDQTRCTNPQFCLATGFEIRGGFFFPAISFGLSISGAVRRAEVLKLYNVDELSLAANFFILLGFIVGLRLIAYLILLRRGPAFLAV